MRKKAINETIKNGKYEKSDKGYLTTPNMSNLESLFSDFPTSFGTVDWIMTAKIVEDGKIETNFNIKDIYIFNDYYADGVTPMNNPFNVIGKKYQDLGFGTPFQWELNIKQTFTY